MKLWIDDTRPAPVGYIWIKSVDSAKTAIWHYEHNMVDDNILIMMLVTMYLKVGTISSYSIG